MKILALEFSSSLRSVALMEGAPDLPVRCLAEARESDSKHTHGIHLIDGILRQAGLGRQEIQGIAVGLGPGSYTGIRMAIALAQGWQLARDLPLFGLGSIPGLARQCQKAGTAGRLHIIVDAQRGEFYLTSLDLTATTIQEVAPLSIVSRAIVADKIAQGERVIGPEANRWFAEATDAFPGATALGELVLANPRARAGETLEPIYLRETTFVKAPPPRRV